MRFQSGHPKVGGRAAGTVNKVTHDIRTFAVKMLEDKQYQERLITRLRNGKAGRIEVLLYFYAYGRPIEKIERTGGNDTPLAFTLRISDANDSPLLNL